jgi:hypothetical protein
MIAGHFDRQTMAAMEIALEKACGRWPNGGTHELRKRVARSIIRCAQNGNTGLAALIEAGETVLAQPQLQNGADIRSDRPNAAQSLSK